MARTNRNASPTFTNTWRSRLLGLGLTVLTHIHSALRTRCRSEPRTSATAEGSPTIAKHEFGSMGGGANRFRPKNDGTGRRPKGCGRCDFECSRLDRSLFCTTRWQFHSVSGFLHYSIQQRTGFGVIRAIFSCLDHRHSGETGNRATLQQKMTKTLNGIQNLLSNWRIPSF
jgi:hypothetical protein